MASCTILLVALSLCGIALFIACLVVRQRLTVSQGLMWNFAAVVLIGLGLAGKCMPGEKGIPIFLMLLLVLLLFLQVPFLLHNYRFLKYEKQMMCQTPMASYYEHLVM